MPNKQKIDLYFAVPFYNEEKRLPDFLNSLWESQKNFKLSLIKVNHRSSDNSLLEVHKFDDKFAELIILNEDYPVHCGGVPRNRAINAAIAKAEENYKKFGIHSPISTIDCDTKISGEFVSDVVRFLNVGYDIVSFPERYDQTALIDWINLQDEKNRLIATRALIGLNFVRYSLLWGLILSDIIETRGPGGYAMFAETWKKLDHKQPFDSEGNPVTGENNQLGIRANRLKLRIVASPHLTLVNPRREVKSSLGNVTKGYEQNKSGSEVFALARETEEMPSLSEAEWSNYLISGIKRSIRMILIRAIAFDKLENIKWWFASNPNWMRILRTAKVKYDLGNYSKEDLDVVGCWVYKEILHHTTQEAGEDVFMSIAGLIDSNIPNTEALLKWASGEEKIIVPESDIIKDLYNKYFYYYESNR